MEFVSALLGLPRPARVLVVATIVGGATIVGWQLRAVNTWSRDDLLAFAALALLVALSEQFWIPLEHSTETENFSLTDAVFAAGLILVAPGPFLLGIAFGAAAGQAARRTAPLKIGFNVGQFVVGLALAAWLYGMFSPEERFGHYTWLSAGAAMAAYVALNLTSVALVISLAEQIPFRSVLLPPLKLGILHSAGNTALGMLAALVIVFEPAALPLLGVPLALSFLAYRGWLRTIRERDHMRELAVTADAITVEENLSQRLAEPAESADSFVLVSTLNRMLDRLERALRFERRFIREASHELRTPITICRGHLEVLGSNPPADRMRAALDVVLDELRRMSRIVDDMATLARAEHPDFIRRGTVELRPFVEEVAVKAQPLLDGRLRTELPGRLARVDADAQRLTQAILNLLHNAALYSPSSSPVHTRIVREPKAWRFEVADSGGGLEPGLEEAIFTPFFRAENGRTGSGLGLAIARSVAEAHGGSAGVDNRPGEGATFWLRIPR